MSAEVLFAFLLLDPLSNHIPLVLPGIFLYLEPFSKCKHDYLLTLLIQLFVFEGYVCCVLYLRLCQLLFNHSK